MPKYPDNIISKLPSTGTSIFTVMSKLAAEEGALNLSQGFPDFDPPKELVELVSKAMSSGFNQYAPMQGLMSLREIIAQKTEALYSAVYDPEKEITITAGATQALFCAITALVKEGDEVIIFTPAYDSYAPVVELCGGKPVFVQMDGPGYKIDWEKVRKMFSRNTKMIIINTPHNPTGSILSAQDMSKLEKITRGTHIIVLSDEVYEHIVFDKYEHQSVLRFPKLAERSIVVSSFGKTFHSTGWKVGYCLAPYNLMEEIRKVHQYDVFSVNTPIQHAVAAYLKNEEHYLSLGAFYQEKRDFFLDAIKGSRFKCSPAAGAYFQLLNYSDISDEKDTDFAIRLTKEFKIASIPVSVFYAKPHDQKVLRFCFAKNKETLEKAAEILGKI